jgi:hypothetical protein
VIGPPLALPPTKLDKLTFSITILAFCDNCTLCKLGKLNLKVFVSFAISAWLCGDLFDRDQS